MHFSYFLSRTAAFSLIVALLFSACTPAAKEARHFDRGERFFKAGEYDAAKIEYLNVLKQDPENAVAYQQIGIIWLEQGDDLQAVRFLSKAEELAPASVVTHAKLGTAFLSLGDTRVARKEALTALKQAPDNGDAILLLAYTVRNLDDKKSTQQQLKIFPNHDNVFFQLASGDLLLHSGDVAGAAQAIQRALTLDPKSPDAHYAMAGVFLARKNLAKAADEFKLAADLSPARGIARLKYAEFEFQSGAVDKAKAILADIVTKTPDFLPAALLQAQITFSEKKIDDSLALVSQILVRDPTDMDAYLLKGQLLLAKGDTKNAIIDLQRACQTYPNLPLLKYRLAQAYLQDHDTARALTALKAAVATSPDYADAVILLATVNLRTGNAAAVVPAMVKLLKKQPNLVRARLLLASAYRSLKQFDDAIAIFRAQIQVNPKDAESYFMLGMNLLEKGDTAQARTAFEKAQALGPLDLVPTYALVELDLLAKDSDAALKRVQSQVEAQPKSSGAQFLLGKVYVAKKDWPEAEAALLKSLSLDPNSVVAYDLLTLVYVAQHKLDQAIKELQAYLAKHPNDPKALMIMGNLYRVTGQPSKAQGTYENLLSARPDYAPALNNLACLYADDAKQLDKAMGLAAKARSLLPEDSSVADTLGWILYRKGDYRQALVLLQESASKPPVAPNTLFHLGMANYMMGYPDAARAALEQAFKSPTDFAAKTEIPARLAFLQKVESGNAGHDEIEAALKLQPADVYAQMALGDAWKREGNWTNAAAAYEQALARNPALISTNLDLADLNAGPLHNPDKALELAKKARELAPSDPRPQGILGRIEYGKGNFVAAYGLLREALTSTTDDAKASATLQDFGWTAYSQGNIAEARGAMERITKAAPPNSPEAEDARSFLALTPDPNANPIDFSGSEAQISTVLHATPNYVPALMAQAQIRIKEGKTQGAVDDYIAVLRRFPNFPAAEKDLASIYVQDPNNQAKAYDLAVKAHNSLPQDAEISELLAEISYQRKQYPYAVQLLQESASRKPLDAQSLYYLGMSLWETKQKPDSRQALHQAIAAGLSQAQLSEANRVLADPSK